MMPRLAIYVVGLLLMFFVRDLLPRDRRRAW